ncbi:hypothetical protein [Saccharothrix sp. Mg75]|uniref:hypothetical protein n=1 Tax=Saccharothrix sp. Mg75 TaxID=3445357 RepID=UPI003EEA6460
MIGHFVGQEPMPGYAAFRAQLGLTVTTLASATDPEAADAVFAQVADEVIKTGDGYATRDVLRYRDTQTNLTNEQREALSDLLISSSLGTGTLPVHLLRSMLDSTQAAAKVMHTSLLQQEHPDIRA